MNNNTEQGFVNTEILIKERDQTENPLKLANQILTMELNDSKRNELIDRIKEINSEQREKMGETDQNMSTKIENDLAIFFNSDTNQQSIWYRTGVESTKKFLEDSKKKIVLLKEITDNKKVIDMMENNYAVLVSIRTGLFQNQNGIQRFFDDCNEIGISQAGKEKAVVTLLAQAAVQPDAQMNYWDVIGSNGPEDQNLFLRSRLNNIDLLAEKLGVEKRSLEKEAFNMIVSALDPKANFLEKSNLQIKDGAYDQHLNFLVEAQQSLHIDNEIVWPLIDIKAEDLFATYQNQVIWNRDSYKADSVLQKLNQQFLKLPEKIREKYEDKFKKTIEPLEKEIAKRKEKQRQWELEQKRILDSEQEDLSQAGNNFIKLEELERENYEGDMITLLQNSLEQQHWNSRDAIAGTQVAVVQPENYKKFQDLLRGNLNTIQLSDGSITGGLGAPAGFELYYLQTIGNIRRWKKTEGMYGFSYGKREGLLEIQGVETVYNETFWNKKPIFALVRNPELPR